MPFPLTTSSLVKPLTPTPEIIDYFKTVAAAPLEKYLKKEGIYEGHRWFKLSANYTESLKLPFSPATSMKTYDNWIKKGRDMDILKVLTLGITLGETTKRGKAEKIAYWIRNNVKYELNAEAPPWQLIIPGINGDCSSFTPLAATMLGIAGISTWEKIISFWGDVEYAHEYILAEVENGWVVIDPTPTGIFTPPISHECGNISSYSLFEWDLTGENIPSLRPPDERPAILPFPSVDLLTAGTIIGGIGAATYLLTSLGKEKKTARRKYIERKGF